MKNKIVYGKAFIKKGSYWLPENESKKVGIKRLLRNTKDLIPIKGVVKNGEVIIDNAYYDEDKNKLVIEVDLSLEV